MDERLREQMARELERLLPPSDTCSTDSLLSEFDCESVPIPPGTKASYIPGQRSLRQTLALYSWPLALGFGLVAFLTGWLLGRSF